MTSALARRAGSKRILVTAQLYGAGGVETHLLNLCRLLVERGAEVTVAARIANPETPLIRQRREIPIRLLATPFARDLRRFRFSTAWAAAVWPLQMRAGSFDLLYTVELSRFARFLRRFVRRDGYMIGNRIGEPLGDSQRLDPSCAPVLDGFIVESEMQAAPVRRSANGLRVAAIPLMAFVHDAPPRQPRAIDCFRVAFLGRYFRTKGVYRLLDIWSGFAGQRVRLDFYGHGVEREGLEQEIRRRGLDASVRVNGGWSSSEELAAIMAATDLVVLPSETEGLPLVLLEAMAYGVPFVAGNVGAISSLAENNPDVRVVGLDNAAFAQAVREMECEIRAGKIVGRRLQDYHRARYGHERLAGLWSQALLEPEQFWRARS
ncbi:MAG: glycosyltransferase family 4 protein [Terriglobales bacterium]